MEKAEASAFSTAKNVELLGFYIPGVPRCSNEAERANQEINDDFKITKHVGLFGL